MRHEFLHYVPASRLTGCLSELPRFDRFDVDMPARTRVRCFYDASRADAVVPDCAHPHSQFAWGLAYFPDMEEGFTWVPHWYARSGGAREWMMPTCTHLAIADRVRHPTAAMAWIDEAQTNFTFLFDDTNGPTVPWANIPLIFKALLIEKCTGNGWLRAEVRQVMADPTWRGQNIPLARELARLIDVPIYEDMLAGPNEMVGLSPVQREVMRRLASEFARQQSTVQDSAARLSDAQAAAAAHAARLSDALRELDNDVEDDPE